MLQLFESDQNLFKLPMSGSFTYVYNPLRMFLTHSALQDTMHYNNVHLIKYGKIIRQVRNQCFRQVA